MYNDQILVGNGYNPLLLSYTAATTADTPEYSIQPYFGPVLYQTPPVDSRFP